MYCRKCGAKIKDTAQFCDECGAEVILIQQKSYSEKYKESKELSKKRAKDQSYQEQKKRDKYKDIKNPYIAASLLSALIAFLCAIFPWNIIGDGIGTSLPMRIIVVVLALLGDYHATKAKQMNNYIKKQYGFEIQSHALKLGYFLSVFMTVIGLFALFMYEA